MPWGKTCVMDERMSFIVDWRDGVMGSFAELCRYYGVSRRTGYKLVERYELEGVAGLQDRSRAPHHHPNALSEEVEAVILALKAQFPTYGPKKLWAELKIRRPDLRPPAVSTIAALLARHGLTRGKRVRRRVPPHPLPLSACEAANDVWGVDFKGWFVLGNGTRCDPLSLSDLATRYVLRLQAVKRTDTAHVWPILDAAFREFGPPLVMRSDNGPPFAGTGAGGLSQLAVRLIKVGVLPERIEPGKPQQNGRHERLHRTIQEDTASPPAFDLRQQQRRFDAFRRRFNEERPHEALGLTPPAAHYQPAPRPYSGRLREPEYPSDQQVRRVRGSGEIKWRGVLVFISQALVGEPVGLEEIDDGCWTLRFGPLVLGVVDADGKFAKFRAGARPRPELQPQPPG